MLASDEDKGKSKEEVQKWTGYPGGAPCNVACGLGLLKIPVAFVSCLGKDDMGDELMQLMRGQRRRGISNAILIKPFVSPKGFLMRRLPHQASQNNHSSYLIFLCLDQALLSLVDSITWWAFVQFSLLSLNALRVINLEFA
jgi:hypothetical protein